MAHAPSGGANCTPSNLAAGEDTFVTGEDLQNLPIVPLHQDFVALSILGVEHCERNGHHYNYGLSMLTERPEQSQMGQRRACLSRQRP